jgi:excisionase family DNA binding protein
MSNEIFNKRAFTVHETAEYACVSRGTVENWIIKGLIRYEELPGTGHKQHFRRIRKIDIDDFLDKNLCAGKEPAMRKNNREPVSIFLKPKST